MKRQIKDAILVSCVICCVTKENLCWDTGYSLMKELLYRCLTFGPHWEHDPLSLLLSWWLLRCSGLAVRLKDINKQTSASFIKSLWDAHSSLSLQVPLAWYQILLLCNTHLKRTIETTMASEVISVTSVLTLEEGQHLQGKLFRLEIGESSACGFKFHSWHDNLLTFRVNCSFCVGGFLDWKGSYNFHELTVSWTTISKELIQAVVMVQRGLMYLLWNRWQF